MSTVFGEVAGLYDRARSGYPARFADLTLTFAGRPPAPAAEVGAGTGKGTALFAGRGFPVTCIEPDERMSALLHERFPQVDVVTAAFEEWTRPRGARRALGRPGPAGDAGRAGTRAGRDGRADRAYGKG